ncbi:MAG: HlyD family efflux transporter periplasmic adaptor subunit [Sulfurovum sp.]|nr:HlyD family efflux transporter periplasmic adaptor subunit [Sulfurovum sp.]MDD3602430.1 HlyD family efflux transporter periplasmic adaptor subunit [Sulfurovum sp.]
MKKIIKIALYVLAGAGSIFAFYTAYNAINKPKIPENFAYGNGRIEAAQINLAPKVPGRLLEIYVEEGDIVEKGQMLARLDTTELEARWEVAGAQIKQAEQNKNRTMAIVEQKKSELALAHENHLRGESLYKSKSISLLQYQQYETAYKIALANLKSAEADVDASHAAIEAAQAQAQAIKVTIDDSTLYAPKKGRVLYKLLQPGEVVASGQRVLVILDLLDTFMTIFLPTAQAGVINYDSEARIVLDALPHIAIPAKVTFISPQAQFTPKQIETQNEREKLMFRVKVTIDSNLLKEHIDKIKTGLPGVAYIRIDQAIPWPEQLSNVPKSYREDSH